MSTFDNEAKVSVPPLSIEDEEILIHIMQYGVTESGGARFAYVVQHGEEYPISGTDLCGPASGIWPEAADMAVTLGAFLGATFECGKLTEHGEGYSPEELAWLEVHAESLGCWASEMEESRSQAG